MKFGRIVPIVLLFIACCSLATAQTNWPQFRGADSRGVASGGNLPEQWSATENVAWKSDIPGRGWSSPIVWEDRVFLTTVIHSGKPEEPKKGLYFGGDRPKPADAVHQWKVFCFDLKTGEVRWERQVHEGKPETPIHLKSSYASETPVTDGERVYCYFGNVGVFCFDFDGKEVWKHAVQPHATRSGWGTAASPVLHRDRLYLVNDNDQDSYLLALDAKTGEQVWRVPRDEKSNWATPFVWQNTQRTEIVTPGTGKVRSYDLDGKLLWSLTGMSSITIATPYEHNGLLYLSSGYVLDLSKPLYAIRPGAAGDISLKGGKTSNEFIAWSQPRAAPYNPSTLIYDNRLYVLYDQGLMRCFKADDGKEVFGLQRLPNGRAFTSSPWAYDGKVFCLNEDGVTFVLKAGDQFEVLHTNSLAEDDMCMATPAIAGDRLLIRTSARLYCIRSANAQAAQSDLPVREDASSLAERKATLPTDADWPTYNYDVTGSRHNVAEKRLSKDNVGTLELKWRFPRDGSSEKCGAINATPSVVNGYVYFGTSTYPRFYKLKPNGEVAWTYEIGRNRRRSWQDAINNLGLIPRDGVFSSALVTEDSVYFGDVTGVAYCLDRQTGKERWTVNTKGKGFPGAHEANLLMASPIRAAGKVIFGGGAYEHSLPTQPGYQCCYGRGFVMALDPRTGAVIWKYDVGPTPEKFDPPIEMESAWGRRVFHYGPSTSSVWSTPSFDAVTNTIFFGTDSHNSPRKPTDDDPRNYTPHSAAVIAVDATTGQEKWVTQTTPQDVWNHTMPSYDPKTGYKDQSIGDTPKVYTISVDGKTVRVVGAGSKNGGFYVMRIDDGSLVAQTPIYTGPPTDRPKIDPRTLALPSPIGGLQTGCATDGQSVYTNGMDAIFRGTNTAKIFAPASGGRVTSISLDAHTENWRYERPKVDWVGGTRDKPLYRNCGDPCASGIAIANGCLFFTTLTSNRLVALDATSGNLLKEISLGPVFAGPSVSRGRVYIGTGNTQWIENDSEAYFPKSASGALHSFGLPGRDDVDELGDGDE